MGGSLPHLMEFYNKHQDKKDQFEILAFHDAQAKTFTELDERLIDIKKNFWNGKDLPFPVLLDSSGDTVKDWGIFAFPTVVIIDPEGKIVQDGSVETVEQALAK